MKKDLRLELRVKNNLLFQALKSYLKTDSDEGVIAKAARAMGGCASTLSSYVTLRNSPWCLGKGRRKMGFDVLALRRSAVAIMKALGKTAEELFPENLYEKPTLRVYVAEVDSKEFPAILGPPQPRILPSPENEFLQNIQNDQMKEQLAGILKTLTPREERVLRMRFGFDDGNERTLEEVGQSFAVSKERIRQVAAKALRKLRHPSRSHKLKAFITNS